MSEIKNEVNNEVRSDNLETKEAENQKEKSYPQVFIIRTFPEDADFMRVIL